ncbi:MAG: HAMP domain-containing protein [Nitrospirota bacterium]
MEDIAQNHKLFENRFTRVVEAHRAGKLETREQREAMHQIWCPISDEIIDLCREIKAAYMEIHDQEQARSRQTIINTTKGMAVLAILVVIIAGAMGLSISRTITKPLQNLTQGTKIIGTGNLDYRIEISKQRWVKCWARELHLPSNYPSSQEKEAMRNNRMNLIKRDLSKLRP